MTREEAKNLLDNLIGMVEDSQDHDYDGALKMGIEALEQPEVIRCGECKWYDESNFCCNFNVAGFYPNDYCSLAERGKE